MARGMDEPFYRMQEIRVLIEADRVRLSRNAQTDALRDFRYDRARVLKTICRLRRKDWHKTMNGDHLTFAMDVYKTHLTDVGVDAYIKFGIDDRSGCLLVVASFKER